ncbi:MAG: YbhB/YbcL family Raf kinase inhibitor-like protein [Syntrophorhabdales bacterium]
MTAVGRMAYNYFIMNVERSSRVRMKVSRAAWLFLWLIFLVFQEANAAGGNDMEISSSAFKDGGKIPVQYVMPGAGGKNVSVPLSWRNVPAGTKSFALSMVDPHPVAQNWVHWLVIDIPADTVSLEEGASKKKMPRGSVELKNSFGDVGYGGPQPPKGTGEHPYVFTLYALSVGKLDLPSAATLPAFKKALEGKVLGSATITGKYGR